MTGDEAKSMIENSLISKGIKFDRVLVIPGYRQIFATVVGCDQTSKISEVKTIARLFNIDLQFNFIQ